MRCLLSLFVLCITIGALIACGESANITSALTMANYPPTTESDLQLKESPCGMDVTICKARYWAHKQHACTL